MMFASVRLAACCAVFLLASSNVSSWAQSSRPGLGSIPYADASGTGVTFRTWAPNATAVGVKGQFNGWATTPAIKEGATPYWSVDIPGAQNSQEYKFRINNSMDRRDPRARRVVNSAGNSVIYNRNAFDWGSQSFTTPWINDLVIYEMHPGTFNAEDWIPSSFDKNISRLDHLKELGVSAIELMPVTEFAADRSWGYNPADIFAIESALGGPDALKRFIKACHERGIAVLIDVVHNHYGPSDLGLWQFDGWSANGLGGIYFYNEAAKAYTWWGDTRPDFSRAEVRQFIRDQIFMFLEEYKVDGFRWDSVFNMIYYNGGANSISESRTMLQDINWEISQSFPGKIRIAEDHAFDANMNFDAVWDVGFHDHIKWQVTQSSDSVRNVNWLADKITAWPSHQRVLFSESHDTVGNLNSKNRLPRDIDAGNPSSIWARKRQLLAASVVLTSPGIPMIFQGQEMNEDWSFAAETSLRWSLTNTQAGIVRAYADMIKARRNKYGGTQGLKGTGVNVYGRDDANKIMTMVRWDAGGGSDDVVVVMNLAATKWQSNNYEITFPSAGTWYVHYNSDSSEYGSDFDNIGPTQVTASGSPAKAAVNMGMYATIIFSKTPPPASGLVSLNPASPDGCVPVEVSYQQSSGPLAGKTNVVMGIGYNGFQFTEDIQMTNQAGIWVATYGIPIGAGEINFVFHDGAATNRVYDNNFGDDWNIGVANCANLPSEVAVNPVQPQGCVPLTISYTENAGAMMNTSNLVLYIGRNNWQDIQSITMGETTPGVWTNQYVISDDTWQLNFVFHNNGDVTNRVWDNNGGTDWSLIVANCINSQDPSIIITNPAASIIVSNSVTNFVVLGYSTNIASMLNWTNQLTGQSSVTFPGSSLPWNINLKLGEGANVFQIKGFGDTINKNNGALDSASNPQYSVNSQWLNGENGGTKWGGGWQLSTLGSSGHFFAQNESNQNVAAQAWGMWAYDGGLSAAVRPFSSRLNVGDKFSVKFENNWIEGGGVIGIGLQNRFGQNLFEYLFVGGDTNYLINDSVLARTTGIPWTDQSQEISFQLTSPNTYLFTVNGSNQFTGTLGVSSETVVDRVRFFNFNAGGGFERNVYFTDMTVTGAPLDFLTYQSEVTITRSYGPGSDPDDDEYATWEEEIAGTNPFEGNSHPPDAVLLRGFGIHHVDIDESVAGRWYDIFVSTNLVNGAWQKSGVAQAGSGGAVTLTFTNYSPHVFYRTGVSTEP
jgi:1,4-alpha-glucan branching enzyme